MLLSAASCFQALDRLGVAFVIAGLPALVAVATHVVLGILARRLELASEHAATERTVGHVTGAELANCLVWLS
jgi:hypothetical protein